MIKIRKEQKGVFTYGDESSFVDFVAAYMRDKYPEYVDILPVDSLKSMIVSGLERARGHGFASPEDLLAFVALMFVMAPNFDEEPTIQTILDEPRIPVEERLDRALVDEMNPSWETVRRNYDGNAWYPELKGEA